MTSYHSLISRTLAQRPDLVREILEGQKSETERRIALYEADVYAFIIEVLGRSNVPEFVSSLYPTRKIVDRAISIGRSAEIPKEKPIEVSRIKKFPHDSVDAPRKWISESKGDSPPQEDQSTASEPNRAIWPSWAVSAPPVPKAKIQFDQLYDNYADPSMIQVSKEHYAQVTKLMESMGSSSSYEEGIRIFSEFLKQTGLLEWSERTELIHSSRVGPEVIMKSGLLSSRALKEKGLPHSNWGQNLGDGVYTVGAQWNIDGWGEHYYKVTIKNAHILRGNNLHLAGLIKIYDLFRAKWKLPRNGDDSLMVPGLPASVFTFDDLLARLPWFYGDVGAVAVSSTLEVLIKAKEIPPDRIEYLGRKKD